MASIATRKGDDGTTGLLYGQRVRKDHPQIEAVGAFDELNAAIGFAKSLSVNQAARFSTLEHIQKNLVALMGELVCAESDAERYRGSSFAKLEDADLARIDSAVADLEASKLSFDGWATPGKNQCAAALDVARTFARRAERQLVGLAQHGRNLRPICGQYINRVADLLWLMARDAERVSSG